MLLRMEFRLVKFLAFTPSQCSSVKKPWESPLPPKKNKLKYGHVIFTGYHLHCYKKFTALGKAHRKHLQEMTEVLPPQPENGIIHFSWELQTFKKYLKLTLVFMWDIALREKIDFCLSRAIASIKKIFVLAGRLGTSLSFYEIFRLSWYFLISKDLSLKSFCNSWGNSYVQCL